MNTKFLILTNSLTAILTAAAVGGYAHNQGYKAPTREKQAQEKAYKEQKRQEDLAWSTARLKTLIEERNYGEALVLAAQLKETTTVLDLLNKGANPNATLETTAYYQGSALYIATANGDLPSVVALLGKGANPNAEGLYGTPLHRAVIDNNRSIVDVLLSSDANPNAHGSDGNDPPPVLFFAHRHDNPELINKLIKAGADVNTTWAYGTTPLHDAAHDGHFNAVKTLLEAGANPDAMIGDTTSEFGPMYKEVTGKELPANVTPLQIAEMKLEEWRTRVRTEKAYDMYHAKKHVKDLEATVAVLKETRTLSPAPAANGPR